MSFSREDAFCGRWIGSYVGPLNKVTHITSTKFASKGFKHREKAMSIKIKEVLVDIHKSVGKAEGYYALI
ncbi:hypothetical protein DL98DRAFT_440330 [Cadophora sp. DSE1049]|nr:hypothetical protein DL98DRAFT_440330 [Cadophora sp. DSE1049]